jgi:hypothetical protein
MAVPMKATFFKETLFMDPETRNCWRNSSSRIPDLQPVVSGHRSLWSTLSTEVEEPPLLGATM